MNVKPFLALTFLFQTLNFNAYASPRCHCPEFGDAIRDSKLFIDALEMGSPDSIKFENRTYSMSHSDYRKLENLKVGVNFNSFIYNGCTIQSGVSQCNIKVSCHLHHKADICGKSFTLTEVPNS